LLSFSASISERFIFKNLKGMSDAGVRDFILGFEDRTDIAALAVFAENVLPVFG